MSGLFAAVEKFVEENGPITGREIYGNIPYSDGSIRVALSYLRRTKKSIHISGWIWEEYGHLIRALAQYSPGAGKDVKKPAPRTKAQHRRRHKDKKRVRVSSIFELGTPRDERRLTSRRRPDLAREAKPALGSDQSSLGNAA
jgi:hypothetical protein